MNLELLQAFVDAPDQLTADDVTALATACQADDATRQWMMGRRSVAVVAKANGGQRTGRSRAEFLADLVEGALKSALAPVVARLEQSEAVIERIGTLEADSKALADRVMELEVRPYVVSKRGAA